MKKLWAIRTVWSVEEHMGKDNIKLFNTRAEARRTKKNLKACKVVSKVSMHRWCEGKECSFISKKVYY